MVKAYLKNYIGKVFVGLDVHKKSIVLAILIDNQIIRRLDNGLAPTICLSCDWNDGMITMMAGASLRVLKRACEPLSCAPTFLCETLRELRGTLCSN